MAPKRKLDFFSEIDYLKVKGHWQLFYHTKEIILSKINFKNSFFIHICCRNEIFLTRQHFQHKLQSLLCSELFCISELETLKFHIFWYAKLASRLPHLCIFFLTLILTRFFFATLFFFTRSLSYGYVSRTDQIQLLWCCFLYVKEATSPHLS